MTRQGQSSTGIFLCKAVNKLTYLKQLIFNCQAPNWRREWTESSHPAFRLHSLGHQGESFGAHGGTWHQLDHHMLTGRLEVDPRHLLQHGGERGHVAALCAGVSSRRVQDVSPVHHQQQYVSLTLFLHRKKKSCSRTSTPNPHRGKFKRQKKFVGAEGRDYSDLPR